MDKLTLLVVIDLIQDTYDNIKKLPGKQVNKASVLKKLTELTHILKEATEYKEK